MAEAKIEETVCEDRISDLPEDLLIMILELLPTKDAVATMFLSKRWLSTWTMVTRLVYKDIDCESKKSVWWFLNKSLQLHKAPFIDILRMELGPQCPTDEDVDIGKLVAKAVDRLVMVLYINLLWSAGPTSLHKSLYSCESLVDLTLSGQILVNVPSSSAYLPNLTELELNGVVYKDDDSLVSLLSSCPVLEILLVNRRANDNVKKFAVKVPTLCDLWYGNYYYLADDRSDGCLVVDAPAVTNCQIRDLSGDSRSIEDMPCLRDAAIHVECHHYPDDKFLTSFSSVLSLDMYLSDEMVKRCTTINFSRLIKLSIRPCGPEWLEPLVLLLGNAPKLKEFLVDYTYIYKPEDFPFSWNQPSPVPACLSSQLEIFEWRQYGARVEEEEFLTYILANSMRLKTATIALRLDLEDQELIIEDLKGLPRVSTICHLFVQMESPQKFSESASSLALYAKRNY